VADDSGQTARDRFAQGILDSIEIAGTPPFGHFGSVNVLFLSRCRQRTVSYWDCYYREAISPYLDYPGFRVFDAALRAAKGKFLARAAQRTLQPSSRL
jgi:hypothetical protein